jgi:hypothetical protein
VKISAKASTSATVQVIITMSTFGKGCDLLGFGLIGNGVGFSSSG